MADTHMFHAGLDVPGGDILVHAGDLTQTGSLDELARVNDFLGGLPFAHKLVIAGNHDRALEDDPEPARKCLDAVTYLEDETVEIAGLSFYGSPWQPEFHSWAFNLPRGKPLADAWAKIPDDTDVLVTHGPPLGIGDKIAYGDRAGCADLLHRVLTVQPRAHLFGHIHPGRGRWDLAGITFANVTTDECMQPCTVIELDT
jgi:3',5'-cyclic AMP phosphodiesterase CpdA